MFFFKPKFWDKNQISVFSILLFPISLLIKLVSFFKLIFIKKYNFSVPVICVGNIYLGGTGKTPFCIELFSILKSLNKNPAFIKKKYNSFKDEFNLLKIRGPVFESKKRKNAINEAIKNNSDVVILDDGFQDFSIKKNLSIICFNSNQLIGNGLAIPSGPLREGLSSLSRANLVIINGKKDLNFEKKILEKNKEIKIFYLNYELLNIDEIKNNKILAFAGIGNPINFFNMLKEKGLDLHKEISFPDHYNYSQKELENLISMAKNNNAILLTTEKDYLRIEENYRKNIFYIKIKIKIENKDKLIQEIKKII